MYNYIDMFGSVQLYRILFLRRARFQRFADQLFYRARMFMKVPKKLYKDISHHSGSNGICGIETFSRPVPENDESDFQIQNFD